MKIQTRVSWTLDRDLRSSEVVESKTESLKKKITSKKKTEKFIVFRMLSPQRVNDQGDHVCH